MSQTEVPFSTGRIVERGGGGKKNEGFERREKQIGDMKGGENLWGDGSVSFN